MTNETAPIWQKSVLSNLQHTSSKHYPLVDISTNYLHEYPSFPRQWCLRPSEKTKNDLYMVYVKCHCTITHRPLFDTRNTLFRHLGPGTHIQDYDPRSRDTHPSVLSPNAGEVHGIPPITTYQIRIYDWVWHQPSGPRSAPTQLERSGDLQQNAQ